MFFKEINFSEFVEEFSEFKSFLRNICFTEDGKTPTSTERYNVIFIRNLFAVFMVIGILISPQAKSMEEIPLNDEKKPLHKTLQFGQSEFEKVERELIKGKNFQLWGIGLFAGNDPFSFIIREATSSDWSHCALILKDQFDQKYCFESTGSLEGILDGVKPQVQIHKWEDTVKSYNGDISTRQFIFDDNTQISTDMLNHYVSSRIATPYEKDLTSLIKALKRENNSEDVSSMFCSELVADCLGTLGCLDKKGRLSDNFMPKDFSQKENIFLVGMKFDKEVPVVKKKRLCGCCIIM